MSLAWLIEIMYNIFRSWRFELQTPHLFIRKCGFLATKLVKKKNFRISSDDGLMICKLDLCN